MEKTTKSTILIVDDNLKELKPLRRFLGESGFRVSVAPNGEQALKHTERVLPNLILLDVLMPGMNGFETCRRFKELEAVKDVPILFMTGVSDTVEKVRGFELGGVDYLIKPVDHDEVLARVRTHLKIRELQEKLQAESRRFQQLAEATLEGIVLYDDTRIVEVNRQLIELFGYSRSEMLDMTVQQLLSPQAREKYSERFFQESVRPYEVEGLDSAGKIFPIQLQIRKMGVPAESQQRSKQIKVAAVLDLSWRQELHTRLNKERYRFGDMIGKSRVMQAVYDKIEQVARTESTVVILGEHGTGKELAARAIHAKSGRKAGPLITVNCGAIPENLCESEFFGYKRGAFTGAARDKSGYFDAADGGTLFLDEFGDIPLAMQVKLLRVLEDRTYIPVGGTEKKQANVRILAATNKDLEQLRQQGRMREDFYYRIAVLEIAMPPLRKRREDIPLLIEHFSDDHAEQKDCVPIPGHLKDVMRHYDWPGNVRELKHEIEHYQAIGQLKFLENFTQSHIGGDLIRNARSSEKQFSLSVMVEEFEARLIREILQKNHHNKTVTAAMLGIDRKTLYTKLKKYDIE